MSATSCNVRVLRQKAVASDIRRLTVALPKEGPRPHAGQFYMLRCWGAAETPVLSRPISVHDVDEREGTLTFLYQIKGEGTQKLAHLAWGQTLTLTGPCGNGFDVAAAAAAGRVAVVGGGIGVAPLLLLCRELAAAGCKPELYAGFRDAPYALEDFLPYCAAISVATDSGAVGYHGLVTGIFAPGGIRPGADLRPQCDDAGRLPPLRRKGRALPGQPGAQDGLRPGRLPGLHLPHESRPQNRLPGRPGIPRTGGVRPWLNLQTSTCMSTFSANAWPGRSLRPPAPSASGRSMRASRT